jgi:aldehyde dehydrogenase (NAD+)
MLKRVSLELGGKNAQIVMDDADLDLALEGVLWGAFGTTGQRCTATSRLILHKKIHDEFVGRLVEKAKKLTLGPGLDEKNEVGPLVNPDRVKAVDEYVKIGRKEGKLLCGGKAATEGPSGRAASTSPRSSTASSPPPGSPRRRSSARCCRS